MPLIQCDLMDHEIRVDADQLLRSVGAARLPVEQVLEHVLRGARGVQRRVLLDRAHAHLVAELLLPLLQLDERLCTRTQDVLDAREEALDFLRAARRRLVGP